MLHVRHIKVKKLGKLFSAYVKVGAEEWTLSLNIEYLSSRLLEEWQISLQGGHGGRNCLVAHIEALEEGVAPGWPTPASKSSPRSRLPLLAIRFVTLCINIPSLYPGCEFWGEIFWTEVVRQAKCWRVFVMVTQCNVVEMVNRWWRSMNVGGDEQLCIYEGYIVDTKVDDQLWRVWILWGNSVLAGPGHGTAIGLPDPSLPSSFHRHQVGETMITTSEFWAHHRKLFDVLSFHSKIEVDFMKFHDFLFFVFVF